MPRSVPTTFQRLRRHRGGWMLLFAALLFKIAAGTACVLDGPGLVSGSATTSQAQVVETASDACLLGEGSDCHCACAHATALPTNAPAIATVVVLPEVVSHLPAAPIAVAARSPLRPPIA